MRSIAPLVALDARVVAEHQPRLRMVACCLYLELTWGVVRHDLVGLPALKVRGAHVAQRLVLRQLPRCLLGPKKVAVPKNNFHQKSLILESKASCWAAKRCELAGDLESQAGTAELTRKP
jgi:hypothetical protein